ncbi:MAG: peroxiredoxin [Xanthomonadales bacterium]|nr:peroxiredoxin [Xanthomonadales bacterium]
MTIQIGDSIPSAMLKIMGENGPQPLAVNEYFTDRKVVLFSVPGAFTPTCSAYHLPGFIELANEFKHKGIDAIGCMSVNDVFVMHAWGKSANATGIDMLADGNGEFSKALGLEMDASAFGMGQRSHRFALVADDGIVTHLMVEAPGEFRVSSAESVLAAL